MTRLVELERQTPAMPFVVPTKKKVGSAAWLLAATASSENNKMLWKSFVALSLNIFYTKSLASTKVGNHV